MTERKPGNLSFEGWIDKQIREAGERGDFDDLKGAGEPLPGADRTYDENWWVRDKMRREQLRVLPSTLVVRRRVAETMTAARAADTEDEVRRLVAVANDLIEAGLRFPGDGPPLDLRPHDVELVVTRWRLRRSR